MGPVGKEDKSTRSPFESTVKTRRSVSEDWDHTSDSTSSMFQCFSNGCTKSETGMTDRTMAFF